MKEVYTVQFMLETGASHRETAMQFRLNNPTLIQFWMKTFNEQGIEGQKPKGRPSMSKKPNKQKNKEEKILTREELERENELLSLENTYLKNLNASLEKHKQNWHSILKKKDSD